MIKCSLSLGANKRFKLEDSLINIDGKTALDVLGRVSSAPARLLIDPICEDIIVNIRNDNPLH